MTKADRHTSGFMVRLPEAYRERLRAYQERHAEQHLFKPALTDIVQKAIDEFLARHGEGEAR